MADELDAKLRRALADSRFAAQKVHQLSTHVEAQA
jgi:hypothetical protein